MKLDPRHWPMATRGLAAAVALASVGLGLSLAWPPPVHRLAADPARVPALPDIGREGGRRADPSPEQQALIAARPLFSPGRRPAPVADATEQTAPFDYVLTGVIVTEKTGLAILSAPDARRISARLEAAIAEAPGWRLIELEPRRAVFAGPGGRRVLDLRTFDGRGGDAPTPIVASPGRDAVARRSEEAGPAGAPVRAVPEPATRTGPAPNDTDAIRLRAEQRRAQRRRHSPSA